MSTVPCPWVPSRALIHRWDHFDAEVLAETLRSWNPSPGCDGNSGNICAFHVTHLPTPPPSQIGDEGEEGVESNSVSDSVGDGSDYEARDPLAWVPLPLLVVPPSTGRRKPNRLVANCKLVHKLCDVMWHRSYEASVDAITMYKATLVLLTSHIAGTVECGLLQAKLQPRIDGLVRHCMPCEQQIWDRAHALLREMQAEQSCDWPREMGATNLLLFAAADRVF
jgi:hypothetical protein